MTALLADYEEVVQGELREMIMQVRRPDLWGIKDSVDIALLTSRKVI
jgi:hypothetical protein